MLFFKQSTDLLAEAVRFELTAPYGTTVFKTAALNRAQPHFLDWYPGRDLNPQQNCLLNSRVYLIVCATGILFGVPYQYRSGTTAFTEQGAGHYTKDTIDWKCGWESNPRLYGFAIRSIGPLWHRTIFGSEPGNRTPSNRFGVCCATVTLARNCLVLAVALESAIALTLHGTSLCRLDI